jgi:hypothetical protein
VTAPLDDRHEQLGCGLVELLAGWAADPEAVAPAHSRSWFQHVPFLLGAGTMVLRSLLRHRS